MIHTESLGPLVGGLRWARRPQSAFLPPAFPRRALGSLNAICRQGPGLQRHPASLAPAQRAALPLRREGILLLGTPPAIFHLGRF